MKSLKLVMPSRTSCVHFVELRVAQVGDDAVEAVIADRLDGGFLHPSVEGGPQGLALVLDSEVDEGRGAAESCGAGAGLEVVGAGGAAKGHVEMGVDIDPPGRTYLSVSIDELVGVFARQDVSDGHHLAALDGDVARRCRSR